MIKPLNAILILSVAGLLSACASTTQMVALPNQANRLDNPDKARVYVMRPATVGFAIPMGVYDGETKIGSTGAKGCLSWEREPGSVEIIGKAENTAKLPLEAQKGMVYYIQQHVRMGFLIARNKLSLLSEEEGKAMAAKCKFTQPVAAPQ